MNEERRFGRRVLLGGAFAAGAAAAGVGSQVAAARWFRRAAEQGLALAQMSLGNRYYRGEGVAKDIVKAIQWLSRAAAQGQSSAKVTLARIRENNE